MVKGDSHTLFEDKYIFWVGELPTKTRFMWEVCQKIISILSFSTNMLTITYLTMVYIIRGGGHSPTYVKESPRTAIEIKLHSILFLETREAHFGVKLTRINIVITQQM